MHLQSALHANSRTCAAGRLFICILCFLVWSRPSEVWAHPMPNSVLLLDIKGHSVSAELQLPLNELELAFGHEVNKHSAGLVQRRGPQLSAYLLQHIHPASLNGKKWTVQVTGMQVQPAQQSMSGPYNELNVQLTLTPPGQESLRHFMLGYDVIIHQVVTHFALVSVRQDWDNGMNNGHPYQVGAVRLDVVNNKIDPIEINVQEGNIWTGFTNMVSLGINHIKEGTDHLLFLLTLLLPATLVAHKQRWGGFGGVKYSLLGILKIVTAFTIGHSVTLIVGALGIFHFPARIIEVLIALSILISAIHALKPIFPGRELFVAAGFGLIHGMAFAETLINLNLDGLRMTLSILGFNLGIELMQLLVIAVTIPWLILLSRNRAYTGLRVAGALFAATAALAWMAERMTGYTNPISDCVAQLAGYSPWLIGLLALAATASFLPPRRMVHA